MNTDKKILIVDDEQSLASMLRLTLISLGYKSPQIANNSREAIEKTRSIDPDIILMDIMLNDRIDGIETAQIIRADYDIPVIFMTGKPSEEIFVRAREAGPYGYLIKPIREEELWSAIENAFQRVQIEKNLEYEKKLSDRYFNFAPAIMVVLDVEGRVVRINTMGAQILGYDADELKDVDWYHTFVPEDTQADVKEVFSKMIGGETGVLRFYENNIVTRDGKERIVSWHNMPLRDDNNTIIALLASGQDVTERRRAEQAVMDKNHEMNAVLKASPVGISLLRERQFVWVNDAMVQTTGYSREELIGDSSRVLYETHEEFRRLGETLYADIAKHGFGQNETRLKRKNGDEFPCILYGSPLDQFDMSRGIILALFDISEPKRIERNLLKTNQMLQLIIYSSPLGIMHIANDGSIIMWNRSAERIFGWTEKEVMGQDVNTVITGIDVDIETELHYVRKGKEHLGNEAATLRKDGTVIHVSVSTTPLNDGAGNFLGVLAMVEDVTEKKQYEEELHRKTQLLSSIVESSPLAIIAVDSDTRVTSWNRAAEMMFGWEEEEVRGEELPVLPDEISTDVRKHFQEVSSSGGLTSFEVQRKKKDGSLIDVNLNVAMLRDPDGNVTGALSIIEDITEKKRARLLLQESEERYRAIVESFHGFIFMCSPEHRVIFMNQKLKNYLGHDITDGKCHEIVFGKKNICEWCKLEEVLHGEVVEQGVFHQADSRWYFIINTPVHHADGSVSSQTMMHDITDRKNAEAELLRRYSQVSALSSIYTTMISSESTIEQISGAILEQAKKLTKSEDGYVSEIQQDTGKNVIHVYSNGIIEQHAERDGDKLVFTPAEGGAQRGLGEQSLRDRSCVVFSDGDSNQFLSCPVELEGELVGQIYLTNPEYRYTGDDAEAINRLGEYYALAIQRKRFERELARKTRELSELYTNLSEIREQERTEISREIHDELGQQLTALKMDVAWLQRRVDAENVEIKNKSEQMLSLIDGTIHTVRRIVSELRPGIIDDLGLVPAIEWLCEQAHDRTGLHYNVNSVKEDYEIDDTLKITVFRIVQEAVNNILKHSRAKNVDLYMDCCYGELSMEIVDDGVGFDTEAVRKKKSYGIIGMKERVQAFGGTVRYDSRPGEGTGVYISIPVTGKKEVEDET